MKKHIYLHTSNLEHIRRLKEDLAFEPTHEYNPSEFEHSHQNEYGRIKTDQNYYHILIGHVKQKGCPWCGAPPILKKISDGSITRHAEYVMQCINCGARGPVLNVNQFMEQNKDAMSEVQSLMEHRFSHRLPWDEGLKNCDEN